MDLFRLDPAEVKRARVEEAVGQEEDVFIASLLENEPMLMMMDSGEGIEFVREFAELDAEMRRPDDGEQFTFNVLQDLEEDPIRPPAPSSSSSAFLLHPPPFPPAQLYPSNPLQPKPYPNPLSHQHYHQDHHSDKVQNGTMVDLSSLSAPPPPPPLVPSSSNHQAKGHKLPLPSSLVSPCSFHPPPPPTNQSTAATAKTSNLKSVKTTKTKVKGANHPSRSLTTVVNDSDFDYEINTEGDNTEGGGDLHDGLGGSTEDEDEGELEESGMGAAVRGGGRPKKGGTVAAASSSSTRRRRDAKQQELNRKAQARYRERKKQKFNVLQSTVEDLESKLETIQRLKDEAEALKKLNEASNVKLCHKELQIQLQSKVIMDQSKALKEQEAKIQCLVSTKSTSTAADPTLAAPNASLSLPLPPLPPPPHHAATTMSSSAGVTGAGAGALGVSSGRYGPAGAVGSLAVAAIGSGLGCKSEAESVEDRIMRAVKEALEQLTLKPPSPSPPSSSSLPLPVTLSNGGTNTNGTSDISNNNGTSTVALEEVKHQVSLRLERILKDDSLLQPFLSLLAVKPPSPPPNPQSHLNAAASSLLPPHAATAVTGGGGGGGYVLLSRAVARRSCGDMIMDATNGGGGAEKSSRVALSITA